MKDPRFRPLDSLDPAPAVRTMKAHTAALMEMVMKGIHIPDLIEFAWSAGYRTGFRSRIKPAEKVQPKKAKKVRRC